jgi:predicted nucleotidyltransferase
MKKLIIRENYTSENLWKKVNILTEDQINAIDKGLEWTVENVPNAVVIGGTAVVHYISGARDLTPDLDFLVNNIGSLKNKFEFSDIEYTQLNPGYGEPIGITVEQFNTDYMGANAVNPELNRLILQTPIKVNIGGYQVNMINPELLAIMKLETSREKDVNDAFKLLSSGKVNSEKYVKFAKQLKDSLQDYESIISYRSFIN